jgi:ribonuclease G
MTKELIISANVHEKKVAILEDGIVSEFYVERSDENQGMVGNLYKGRVMKVLPGMQSAFVDIALERDAFLYVSDFAELMEDGELIEYKDLPEDRGEAKPGSRPKPRPDDRREHEHTRPPQPPFQRGGRNDYGRRSASETPSDGSDFDTGEAEGSQQSAPIQDAVEQLAEMVVESVIPPPSRDEDMDEGIGAEAEAAASTSDLELAPPESISTEEIEEQPEDTQEASAEVEAEVIEEKPEKARSRRRGAARPEPPKPQRKPGKKPEKAEIVKEAAAKPGDLGGGRVPPGRRGSRRRPPALEQAGESPDLAPRSSFERVTDDDMARMAGELLKDAIVQEKIIERVHKSEYRSTPEPQPETRVGTLRSQLNKDSRFQRVHDEEEAAGSPPSGPHADDTKEGAHQHVRASAESESGEHGDPQAKGPSLSAHETHSAEREDQDLGGTSYDKREDRNESVNESSSARAAGSLDLGPSDNSPEGYADSNETQEPDREAAVKNSRLIAEFAIRRGERGRRRRREPPASGEEGRPRPEGPPAVLDEAEPPPSAPLRPAPPAQAEPQRRPEFGPPQRSSRRPDIRNPTISELLREGQEILVQIAKEPIAKKGARITSHIALPGRYLVYMPTVNHIGVSRKIGSEVERIRLKRTVTALRDREGGTGGFIVRTACEAHSEQELQDDMRYLLRTWSDIKKKAEKVKSPALVHRDLDLVQRILRDHLSADFSAIRIDNEVEYARLIEFVNRIQPRLVKRVKLYTGDQPILEKYGVQQEIDKAVKPRVWLRSGGYIVINQTEALVAIDVNTGKFVGKSDRLEDTITRTNLEAAKEIVRQIRLRDLGGIIVLDLIDMEERKNRQRVMAALQQELQADRAPSKILSINDFGLVAITRKRVKQSLERTLCTPCPYCQGGGLVKSPQTMCFEILEQAKAISKQVNRGSDVTLRVAPDVAEAFRSREREVFEEIEAYFSVPISIEADAGLHREQYDFAIV